HKMATTDDGKNDRSTKALVSQLTANAPHAVLKNIYRLVVLTGLVVSRTQVIVGHHVERAIFPDAGKCECPLADLYRTLRVARQSIVAVKEVQNARKSLLIPQGFRKGFCLVQVLGDPR